MNIAELEYAAQELLAFLAKVGPLEAVWAMTTALEELQDLPASANHQAAAAKAFAEAQAADTEAADQGQVAEAATAGEPDAVIDESSGDESSGDKSSRGKKAQAPQ
jgi:hypothetical protein